MTPAVWPDYLEMDPREEQSSPRFGQWISARDRLPEEDSRVLAFGENGIMIANYLEGWFYYIENEDGDMCPSDDIEVSYWMPLPEPPKMEKKHE